MYSVLFMDEDKLVRRELMSVMDAQTVARDISDEKGVQCEILQRVYLVEPQLLVSAKFSRKCTGDLFSAFEEEKSRGIEFQVFTEPPTYIEIVGSRGAIMKVIGAVAARGVDTLFEVAPIKVL